MKNLLLCTCLLLCLGAVCSAQSKDDDFSGFYVGANVGGAFSHDDVQTSTIFSPTGYFASTSVTSIATVGSQKVSPNGFVGGGTIGYTHQFDDFFVGVEGDFGAMNLDETVTSGATYPCCAPTSYSITQNASTSWLITVRPRMGFVIHHAAIYGTVGPAFTTVNYKSTLTDTFATAHESQTIDEMRPGYAAGGGMEYAVRRHWSVKGEYLYTDFGTATAPSTNLTAFTPAIAFPSNVFTHSVHVQAHIVRFGFNYRF